MSSPLEQRAVLKLLTTEAVDTSAEMLGRLGGSPEIQRLALLDNVPALIDYYAQGSAALAADFYSEQRELAAIATPYTAELVLVDRTVKIRRAIAWSAEPLFDPANDPENLAGRRLAEVVQLEVARPYRDTITTNRRNDAASVGWRRITRGGCKMCRMLADRGAVYKEATVHFATHPSCHCTAQPVFRGQPVGEEASVIQYMGSKQNRSTAQQAQLRDYLDAFY